MFTWPFNPFRAEQNCRHFRIILGHVYIMMAHWPKFVHKVPLKMSQYLVQVMTDLAPKRRQALTLTNIEHELCRYMSSLSHYESIPQITVIPYPWIVMAFSLIISSTQCFFFTLQYDYWWSRRNFTLCYCSRAAIVIDMRIWYKILLCENEDVGMRTSVDWNTNCLR